MPSPAALSVRLRRHSCIAATLAILTACSGTSDSPTLAAPNGAPRLAVAVVSGTSQQGFSGQPLPAPVTVQVVDSAGRPVPGAQRIRFSIVAGAGSVSDTSVLSTQDGSASVVWRLGAAVGVQQLAASLADIASSSAVNVTAEGLSPDAADLVVIRGATSGDVTIVIRQDNLTSPYTLSWPDTVLRLLPRAKSGNWQEVTAFSFGHPPVTALQPWTAGRDTIRLVLGPPIAVRFTVWVTHDYDETAARAIYDLGNVDEFWRSQMSGLRVGTIRFENAPEMAGTIWKCEDSPARSDPSAVNIYYVPTMVVDNRPAYACSASRVLMGPNTLAYIPEYKLLLNHEIGHALALDHVADVTNFMNGYPWGGRMNTGQIYWMHFADWSAVNSVMGARPAGMRNCASTLGNCLPQTFTAW